MMRSPSTKRLAVILHDLRGGGAERIMLRLASAMAERGRDVDLVLVQARGEYMRDVPASVRMIALNAPRVSASIWSLVRYLQTEKPAAVLTALTHMNVAVVLAARLARWNGRIVLSERNQMSAKARQPVRMTDRIAYQASRWAYHKANAVVSVSHGVAQDLERLISLPCEKSKVIYNPVYTDQMVALSQQQPDHSWFSEHGPPVVLATGRLHHQKGFDVLLDAFALVRATVDARLIILGEGGEREALKRRSRQLNIEAFVDFPGFVANPYAYMARAAVFVLSSRWEGLPGALIEAMGCNCPVIATDCPSGPREILEGGRFGTLVPPDDPAQLATALLQTIAVPPGGAAARARAFSVAAATDAYLALLEG